MKARSFAFSPWLSLGFLLFLGALLTGVSALAQDRFSLAEELQKPGVKLVVLEFYASWCMPCRAAVKDWDLLHQQYQAKGLRFVVVTVGEEGGCTNPGWAPDRVICDKDGYWQKKYGVEKLPQAFLYTWQGELISERAHVEQVEKAIGRFFKETQLRMTIDQPEVIGDKYAIGSNPEWVRDYVRGEVRKGSKFDVVDEATKALPKQLEGGQCSVSFPPNSDLRIKLFGDGEGQRSLTLTLEKDGCVLASSQQPYKGQGFKEDADSLKWAMREAVKEVLATVTKVKLPRPMVLGKPGGEDWFEEVEVAVVSFEPSPKGVVMVDGKLLCAETPCSKSLTPGSHEVTISAENYVTRTETLNAKNGLKVDWKLVPDFGLLSVTTVPEGLEILIDKLPAGKSPLRNHRVDPGKHLIESQSACHYPASTSESFARGDQREVTLKPEPILGGLEVAVKDEKGNDVLAEASLDGEPLGQAPGRFKVSVCGKVLKVSAPGYTDETVQAEVREKKMVKVAVTLAEAKDAPHETRNVYPGEVLRRKSDVEVKELTHMDTQIASHYHVSSGDDGEEIVFDERTKLTWTGRWWKDVTWHRAFSGCKELMYAGHSGWRLPHKAELEALLDKGLSKAPYSTFPQMPATWFWTSTAYNSFNFSDNRAWYVDFVRGDASNRFITARLAARCVRP